MAKQIGFVTTAVGGVNNSYTYLETAAGESVAIGCDETTENLCINTSASTGVVPNEATAIITVSSAANGDLDFAPNGTGKSVFLNGNVDVHTGNLLFNNTKGNNGQVPIGSTAGTQAWAALTAGTGIAITTGANSITVAASGSVAETFDGDTGSAVPAAGVITFTATPVAGATTSFSGSGSTLTLNSTDANNNVIIGASTTSGASNLNNVGIGYKAFNLLSTGVSGNGNVAIGANSMQNATASAGNTCVGYESGIKIGSAGNSNCFYGQGSGAGIISGSLNSFFGTASGSNLATGTESGNVLINDMGVNGDTGALRIGTTLTGSPAVTSCYIGGINTVNVGSVASVVSISGDHLGSTTITAGTNVTVTAGANTITLDTGSGVATSFAGDSGTATPSTGTITFNAASNAGATPTFVASSHTVNLHVTDASHNTIIGAGTTIGSGNQNTGLGDTVLSALTGNTGSGNTAIGFWGLRGVTTGINNTSIGISCATALTTGNNNLIAGLQSGDNLVSGSSNVLMGFFAGKNYTGAESNNICIQDKGVVGESNVIRISTAANSVVPASNCYIGGISGVTVGGSGVPVVVDTSDHLGTVVSSIRYKENVEDMLNVSNDIYKLRAKTFDYKENKGHGYGFIAEDVEHDFPELVVYNREGKPETVRYLDIIPMLVNEIQKLSERIKVLEG